MRHRVDVFVWGVHVSPAPLPCTAYPHHKCDRSALELPERLGNSTARAADVPAVPAPSVDPSSHRGRQRQQHCSAGEIRGRLLSGCLQRVLAEGVQWWAHVLVEFSGRQDTHVVSCSQRCASARLTGWDIPLTTSVHQLGVNIVYCLLVCGLLFAVC